MTGKYTLQKTTGIYTVGLYCLSFRPHTGTDPIRYPVAAGAEARIESGAVRYLSAV